MAHQVKLQPICLIVHSDLFFCFVFLLSLSLSLSVLFLQCNLVLGNCSTLFPPRAGSMGRAIPGHVVDIVDESTGMPLPDGHVGCIGVKSPHPVMMLRYWKKDQATKDKYVSGYLLTGDLAKRDSSGFFTFFGRGDDVIKSSGYRIGPAEIEECVLKQGDCSNCAAIGVPDEKRGERVKVYAVLRPEAIERARAECSADGVAAASDADCHTLLRRKLAAHVKRHLAAYEYPREVEFVAQLPMTPTGKVMRKDLKAKHMKEHPKGHKYTQTE
jgi:acetyl-CoA synthetase